MLLILKCQESPFSYQFLFHTINIAWCSHVVHCFFYYFYFSFFSFKRFSSNCNYLLTMKMQRSGNAQRMCMETKLGKKWYVELCYGKKSLSCLFPYLVCIDKCIVARTSRTRLIIDIMFVKWFNPAVIRNFCFPASNVVIMMLSTVAKFQHRCKRRNRHSNLSLLLLFLLLIVLLLLKIFCCFFYALAIAISVLGFF